jgi:hypothetical protein
MNRSLLFLTLLVAVFTACTTTITREKDPVFAVSTDSLKFELGKMFGCENLRVSGREIV